MFCWVETRTAQHVQAHPQRQWVGPEEDKMLHRLFEGVRRTLGRSQFETYLISLQRHNSFGAPTPREAIKDYQAALGSVVNEAFRTV